MSDSRQEKYVGEESEILVEDEEGRLLDPSTGEPIDEGPKAGRTVGALLMNLSATKFLTDLSGRYASQYQDAVSELIVAFTLNNDVKMRAARMRLFDVTRETMGGGGGARGFPRPAICGSDLGGRAGALLRQAR